MWGSRVSASADVGRDGDASLDGALGGGEIGMDAARYAARIVGGECVGIDGDEAGVLTGGMGDVHVMVGEKPGDRCGGTTVLRGLQGKNEKDRFGRGVVAGWKPRGEKPGSR